MSATEGSGGAGGGREGRQRGTREVRVTAAAIYYFGKLARDRVPAVRLTIYRSLFAQN